jgi:two-component system response regulator NreC
MAGSVAPASSVREDPPVTKIFLVEDHPLFRMGIRQSLAAYAEFSVIGEAGTARDAFAAIDAHPPDIVVMDVSLPGMDGVIATREIRRRAPRTRVLLLSVHDQISDVLEALDAGASGYALKTEGTEALVAALRTIIRNDRYVAPSLAALLGSYESRRKKPLDTLSILSLREREVFRLAADCLLTREIARELCISRKTVDTHLYRIHRKLGLRTSAELVRMACNLGLVRRGSVRDSQVGDAQALVSEGLEGA